MPEDVFTEVIAPILQLKRVALLAISTLGSKPSAYQYRLLEIDFFDKEFVEYVCQSCYDAGKREVCIHNVDAIPHWNSASRLETIQRALGAKNDKKYQLECLGKISDGDDYIFPKDLVYNMVSMPRVNISDVVNRIFISVDPNVGVNDPDQKTYTSFFVIMSMCAPYTTFVGMEELNIVDSAGWEPVIDKHIQAIRANPFLQNATLVFDVEAGTGTTAPDVERYVQKKYVNTVFMQSEAGGRKKGTYTTATSKELGYRLTKSDLQMKNVRIAKDLITSHPNPEEMIERLQEQMLNYRRIAQTAKNAFQATKYTYSGKGENNRDMDDLATTMQRVILARKMYVELTEYDHIRF